MNENVGTESQASAPERPVVLVADDEPSMLELVSQHLKTMHEPTLEVVEASDGEQAWKLAQELLPDLVVLDVMMPGMSGWEVCRKIREDVALAHTAVVMLTGIGENLNQMTSPLYGADGYLDKPFEFEELDEKVREALAARAQQRGGIQRPKTNGVHHAGEEEEDDGDDDAQASIPPDEDTADDLERAAKLAAASPKAKKKTPAKAKKTAAAPARKKTAPAAPKKAAAPARKKTAAKKAAPAKKAPAKKKAAAAPKKTGAKKKAAPAKKAATKSAKKSAAKKKTVARKSAPARAAGKTAAPKKTVPAKKKTAKKKSRR